MSSKVYGVFPGQGFLRPGVGEDLYMDPEGRRLYDLSSRITGINIPLLSFKGTVEEQSDQVNSQLLTFVNSYILGRLMGKKFDCLGGYSLGEVTALCTAGVFGEGDEGFENGLRVVAKRAEIVKKYSPFDRSCLVSVRGCGREDVEEFCKSTDGKLVVSLYCSSTTHVIGGHPDNIEKYKDEFPGESVEVKVNGPYHTKYYEKATEKFKDFLSGVGFIRRCTVDVVANCTGERYTTVEDTIENMGDQLCNPVLWDECVRNMGAGTYVEMGPGKFLTRLFPEILEESKCYLVQGIRDIKRIKERL